MSDTIEPVSVPDDIETDAEQTDAEQTDAGQSPQADLPPVQPPSAGFIIQLFLVPGLIVLAVVGVWALFGKLASSEQDWKTLIVELNHSNEHRRWRGAHGLAQMLQADQQRKSADAKLTQNPVIVGELTQLLAKELAKSAPNEKDLKFQEFLARTLGVLELPDKVFPILREAMRPDRDKLVRKNAILSFALIADRMNRHDMVLDDASVMDDLIESSGDDEPLIRQVGAYTLGIVGSERAKERLIVMLDDSDRNTRLNAAVGLARCRSTAGIVVFQSVLVEAATPFDPTSFASENEVERTKLINDGQFQYSIRLRTTFKAIETLSGELTSQQRTELTRSLEQMTDYGHLPRHFRNRASSVLRTLKNAAD